MWVVVVRRVDMSDKFLGRGKEKIVAGDSVKIIEIPVHIPYGLPQEDQLAIQEQIGKTLTVIAFNQNGEAELEFTDGSGCFHTIWLSPCFLERIGSGRPE
jgi:hypothetical protein